MASLAFSEQLNGKSTYFLEKIWASLIHNSKSSLSEYEAFASTYVHKFGKEWECPGLRITPKLHTIRHDEKNQWKAGRLIHPVIHNRTPDRFQFAPEFPCVSVQKIELWYHGFALKSLTVDGRRLSWDEIETLAVNDGFDNRQEFLKYFNSDFSGKIIHFTDLRY